MTEYVITYFGGSSSSSAEEGAQNMQEYSQWMNSLGETAVSPANPLKNTQTIASNGVCDKGSATQMSGFTIIKADTMDDAMSIAQRAPF